MPPVSAYKLCASLRIIADGKIMFGYNMNGKMSFASKSLVNTPQGANRVSQNERVRKYRIYKLIFVIITQDPSSFRP